MSRFFYIILIAFLSIFSLSNSNPEKIDSVKIYRIDGITVSTNKAEVRKSPIAFSEIAQKEIQQIYTSLD